MSVTDPQHIAVVIPALNEERAIRDLVESVLQVCPHVIVVNDGSTDGTVAQLDGLPVHLISHETPRGKGEALRAGFTRARALGLGAVVTMDGDGQHVAADIPRMLAAARQFPGHIVIAARTIGRDRQPPHRRWANDFADWGIGWGVGQRLVDSQSGQRYYPREVLELCADVATRHGFVFESEILMEANWRAGARVVAVPIQARYDASFRASHVKALPDFMRITRHVIWKVVRRGNLVRNYRASRATAPLLVDPPVT